MDNNKLPGTHQLHYLRGYLAQAINETKNTIECASGQRAAYAVEYLAGMNHAYNEILKLINDTFDMGV